MGESCYENNKQQTKKERKVEKNGKVNISTRDGRTYSLHPLYHQSHPASVSSSLKISTHFRTVVLSHAEYSVDVLTFGHGQHKTFEISNRWKKEHFKTPSQLNCNNSDQFEDTSIIRHGTTVLNKTVAIIIQFLLMENFCHYLAQMYLRLC